MNQSAPPSITDLFFTITCAQCGTTAPAELGMAVDTRTGAQQQREGTHVCPVCAHEPTGKWQIR